MTSIPSLSERRHADRCQMAAELTALAELLGATVETTSEHARHIRLDITAKHGLLTSVELDGQSWQPDIHVIPWHLAHTCQEKLSPAFGQVNPYHFRKATHVAYGWAQLLQDIERGLSSAADRSAFQ